MLHSAVLASADAKFIEDFGSVSLSFIKIKTVAVVTYYRWVLIDDFTDHFAQSVECR
jgi:hypothetical protein